MGIVATIIISILISIYSLLLIIGICPNIILTISHKLMVKELNDFHDKPNLIKNSRQKHYETFII
jgi:hypothetical protein